MTCYRLYFMSAYGAHIERFELIDAACDSEAINMAEAHSGVSSLELYDRGRKVHQFSPMATTSVLDSWGETAALICSAYLNVAAGGKR